MQTFPDGLHESGNLFQIATNQRLSHSHQGSKHHIIKEDELEQQAKKHFPFRKSAHVFICPLG